MFIVAVLLLATFLAAVVAAAIRCMGIGRRITVAVGMSVACISAVLGMMPILASMNPESCSEVLMAPVLKDSLHFPVALVVACCSCGALGIACAKMQAVGLQRLNASARVATFYLIAASTCNVVGAVGSMLSSCVATVRDLYILELVLLAFWMTGSVVTNLILQRLLVMQANIVDRSSSPARLGKIYTMEITLSCAFLVCGCCALFLNSNDIRHSVLWAVLNGLLAFILLLLTCLDLAFSFVVFRVMYRAVHQTRLARAVPASSLSDSLAHAAMVANLNLAAIVTSVFTTSTFYIMICVELGMFSLKKESAVASGVFFASWMLDSLSNDLCALLLGFGPTQSALAVVSSAQDADVIGTPMPIGSSTPDVPVIGNIVPPSDGVADGLAGDVAASQCRSQDKFQL